MQIDSGERPWCSGSQKLRKIEGLDADEQYSESFLFGTSPGLCCFCVALANSVFLSLTLLQAAFVHLEVLRSLAASVLLESDAHVVGDCNLAVAREEWREEDEN